MRHCTEREHSTPHGGSVLEVLGLGDNCMSCGCGGHGTGGTNKNNGPSLSFGAVSIAVLVLVLLRRSALGSGRGRETHTHDDDWTTHGNIFGQVHEYVGIGQGSGGYWARYWVAHK